jgi:hypothetical protein
LHGPLPALLALIAAACSTSPTPRCPRPARDAATAIVDAALARAIDSGRGSFRSLEVLDPGGSIVSSPPSAWEPGPCFNRKEP